MTNFNFRFVLKTLGFLLIIESLFMMTAAIVAFYCCEISGDAILASCAITLVCGMLLRFIGFQEYEQPIGKRESFFMVASTWVVLSVFGMLPYYLSGVLPNISDAFFETMSGFTTTGSSTIPNVDIAPRGILFWRSLTQWIGGIGIIVFALALLPILGGNASFLYDAETTGITHDKFRPRVTQVAKRLWLIYIFITLVLIGLLSIGPMNVFDAVCHAMSTLSTGGYSTKQASVAFWHSPYTEYVISLFTFIGGINFTLIYFAFNGRPLKIVRDEEFRWYFILTLSITLIIAGCLFFSDTITDVEESFRASLFQVITIITSTGFATADYTYWGAFYSLAFGALMLFCACAGSTSGGIKIVRLIVLCKRILNEFKLQVHPNAILPVRLNNTVVPTDIATKALAFTLLYLVILGFSFLVLSFTGMGFEESIGAALTSMGNVGPGLGTLGPSGNFSGIPDFSKWYMSFLMLIGRLELFTVLSLFIPAFWRR